MKTQFQSFSREVADELHKALKHLDIDLFVKELQKEAGEDTGTFEVIASTAAVDRHGEVIDQSGWMLENYMKNPVILFGHDYWSLPVGIATEAKVTKEGLLIKGKFASEKANPFAQQVRRLYDEKIMRAVSVGFIPLEFDPTDDRKIIKAELLELSFVPVPANQEALTVRQLLETAGVAAKSINLDRLYGKVKHTEPTEEEPKDEDKEEKEEKADEEKADEKATSEELLVQLGEALGNVGNLYQQLKDSILQEAEKASVGIIDIKDISEVDEESLAVKVGRVLSDKNRKRLQDLAESLAGAAVDLNNLLDETDQSSGDKSGDEHGENHDNKGRTLLSLDEATLKSVLEGARVIDKIAEQIIVSTRQSLIK